MTDARLPPWRLETHEVLGSTNDRAIAAAEAGVEPGLAVLALRQSAGRGRRGRAWQSLPGNLNLSVLLPAVPWLRGAAPVLAAAVAMHDAVRPLLPVTVPLHLRFPNDLLSGGAKLGGVLIEAGTSASGAGWLVIGIGLNLAAHPALPDRPTASVAALGGSPPPPVGMAWALLSALSARLALAAGEGQDALRDAWMARSFPTGTAVSVTRESGTIAGLYRGLAGNGGMLLEVEGRVETIIHGDIALGP